METESWDKVLQKETGFKTSRKEFNKKSKVKFKFTKCDLNTLTLIHDGLKHNLTNSRNEFCFNDGLLVILKETITQMRQDIEDFNK